VERRRPLPAAPRFRPAVFGPCLLFLAALGAGHGARASAVESTEHLAPVDLSAQRCSDPHLLSSDPFAAACYWRGLLADERGSIPAGAKQRAYEHLQRMRTAKGARPLAGGITGPGSWTPLGPGNMGGRIRSIVRHPTDANTIWVGSVGGGVLETTNGGGSWSATDDFMANLAVSTLVLDASDATSSTLYAGTGEGFGNADAIRGAGIYKTSDAGAHWTQLPGTGTSDFWFVNRLALSSSGVALLAATSTGLWLNPNVKVASTWTRVIATSNGYSGGPDVLDVAFNPADNSQAIASTYGLAWYVAAGSDARQATAAWTASSFSPALLAPTLSQLPALRIELAYAPSHPTTVFASIEENDGTLFRSTDGGATYSLVNAGTGYFKAGIGEQGWYDSALWVDPTTDQRVIVGGVDLWLSVNGGKDLTRISEASQRPASAHADQHVIVSDPAYDGISNKTVYFGNDGGIYKTSDVTTVGNNPPGYTHGWISLNDNLPITQFYRGAVHAATGRLSGGTQDNGTPGYTGSTNAWVDWTGGDGGATAADPTDASGDTWYGEYVYLFLERTTAGFSPGANTPIVSGGIGCGSLDDAGDKSTALFVAPFVLDPNAAGTLLGGGLSLWRSTNLKAGTPCWSPIKPPSGPKISAIAIAPGDSNLIWVGYADGQLAMTTDGTLGSPTWKTIDDNGPANPLPNRQVTSITIDPSSSDVVYVTFGGYVNGNVWRTTDGGSTWADISGGLPAAPIFSLAVKPDNSNWLYVGTDVGIFDTQNGLAATPTWSVNDGPANVAVTDLFWLSTGPGTHSLMAATHGRGMWRTASPLPAGTVAVTLAAAPAGGTAPFTANLKATVAGATGTVNYTFWWNCPAAVSSVQQGIALCGDPTNPAIGAKFDTLSTTTFRVTTAPYVNPGTYTALVVAERGSGAAAAASAVAVEPPGLSVALFATPASGLSPLSVSLTATLAGATGPIDYSIWWSCGLPGTDLASLAAQCGALPAPAAGQCLSSSVGYACKGWPASQLVTPAHLYATPGSFAPKVVAALAGVSLTGQAAVTVTSLAVAGPNPLAPGSSNAPGQQLDSLVPTLSWAGVAGADAYGIYVSRYPYGESNLVYQNELVPGSASQLPLPRNVLAANGMYRWNMRARIGASWSDFSPRLYFTTSSCAAAVTPSQVTVGPAGNSYALVSVATAAGCSWTWNSQASWILGGPYAPHFIYAASNSGGSISAYSIDGVTGALAPIPGSPFPAGGQPSGISADPLGRFVYTINLVSHNVTGYAVDPATGVLTAIPGSPFPAGSGPIALAVDPTGRFLYATSTNSGNVSGYLIDQGSGALSLMASSPFRAGSFPAAITIDPSGRFAYVANDAASDISAYTIDATSGALWSVPGSPFPTGSPAPDSLAIEPTGRFLYGANGGGGISAMAIDGSTGALTSIPGSPFKPFPQNSHLDSLTVEPSGRFLYVGNFLSGTLSAYTIDPATGALGSPFSTGVADGFVAFDPAARFAYLVAANQVAPYTVDANTGALLSGSGSPLTGGAPVYAAVTPSYISVASTTGSASGTVSDFVVTVSANAGPTRSGTIAIAGQTVTMIQGGAGCTYVVDPSSRTFSSSGGSGTVAVAAGNGCGWNSASTVDWITVTAGDTGTGAGALSYTVSPNTGASSRTGDLMVAGRTVTVAQGGVGCAYTLLPNQGTLPPAVSAASIAVATGAACPWTWESQAPSWLTAGNGGCVRTGTFTGAAGGFTVCAAANPGPSRTGTISIAGQTFTMVQGAAGCSYQLDPATRTFSPEGGTAIVTVTAAAGCDWNSTSSADWLTLVSGEAGSGPGTAVYAVAANTSAASRSGIISVAGQDITVVQGGAGCSYAIAPILTTAGSSSGYIDQLVTVTAGPGCAWTWESHAPGWLYFDGCLATGSSSGSGTFRPCVGNNTGASRTGTISIAGQTFTLVQNAASCGPLAAPTATNNGPVCAGGSLGLFASTVAGAGYNWLGPAGFASAAQNPVIAATTTAAAGTYAVTATVAGCTSAVGTTLAVINPAAPLPTINAPTSATAGVTGLLASTVFHTGSTYAWSITNGTVTGGDGTNQVTFTAGTPGVLTIAVVETPAIGCPSPQVSAQVAVVPPPGLRFYTLTPCRVIDTRNAISPYGGPPLAGGTARTFVFLGQCGLPATAKAVSLNVTVTQPTAEGYLRLYPGNASLPSTSTINYRAGQTRANNAISGLGTSGDLAVHCDQLGNVQLIVDINGYFQ
jgi:6-phosphogluconolactonase (cycloisomerase 2 family)